MKSMCELLQAKDWKTEKHVPVIECPDAVKKDEKFEVTVSVGKEVSHPNTTEHHIRWIQLFFKPEGGNSHQMANCEFSAHGASTEGPNTGPAYTDHVAKVTVALNRPGTLLAMSFCNIHGLWEYSKEVKVS